MQNQHSRKWHRRGVIVLGGLVLAALLWTATVRQILQWEFQSAMAQAVEIHVECDRAAGPAVLLPGDPLFQAMADQGGNLDLRSPFINPFPYLGISGFSWKVTVFTETDAYVFELYPGDRSRSGIFHGAKGLLFCTADLNTLDEMMRIAVFGAAKG